MAKAKKLKSGSWRCLVYSHTDAEKKRHYESFTADTRRDAEFLAAEFAAKKKSREKPTEITIGEIIDNYIAAKDGVLSPTTIIGYKRMRKYNLNGIIGIKEKKLTQQMIQQEINRLAKEPSKRTGKPLSSKSILNVHGLLSAALLMHDPMRRLTTTLPSGEKKIIELPSVDIVFNAIKGTDIEVPCLLSMWLSFSISEIRGIKASGITDAGTVTIRDVVIDIGKKKIEKPKPKTYARTRKARLPEYLLNLIKNLDTYKQYKETGIDTSLIAMSRGSIYKRFISLQKQHGLPHIRIHDLRHLNASVMLMLNIPDKYAMERGGWSTSHTMKNVYQHTFSDERKIVDDKVDGYFNNIIKKHEMQHEMQHE